MEKKPVAATKHRNSSKALIRKDIGRSSYSVFLLLLFSTFLFLSVPLALAVCVTSYILYNFYFYFDRIMSRTTKMMTISKNVCYFIYEIGNGCTGGDVGGGGGGEQKQ